MIEEMYKEEFGDSSEDSNPPANNYSTREDTSDCVEDWIKNPNNKSKMVDKYGALKMVDPFS